MAGQGVHHSEQRQRTGPSSVNLNRLVRQREGFLEPLLVSPHKGHAVQCHEKTGVDVERPTAGFRGFVIPFPVEQRCGLFGAEERRKWIVFEGAVDFRQGLLQATQRTQIQGPVRDVNQRP